MSTIELDLVSKRWDDTVAVNQVSFEVAEGSFAVLLGPSGCGKSTTLRLVAGLEQVSEGRIRIGGRDVTHEPPAARRLAMVFQSYALFPHLSVAENILFGLKVRKVAADERARRLDRVAKLLGLGELLARKPAQLSGGQQQRVALARALAPQPALLLLDEPLSALDAKVREGLRHEIVAIQRRLGIPTIMVTHDQEEALEMADRVVLMDNGEIAQEDSPLNLYRAPTSRFSAGFVGRVNLLSAVIEEEGLRIGPTLWPAHPCWSAPCDVGASVTLAVRPQQISIFPEGSSLPLLDIADDAVVLPGRVTHVRFAGASWGLEVQCEALNQVLRVEQMNIGQATAPWGTDSRVLLAIPHAALLPVPASASL